jgi:glycosyltransferase involved in cell wall biosynthesis
MLTFLRRMNKGSVIYLPLEDGQSKALLPLLLGVAAFSSAGRVMVVQSDGSVRAIGRAQTISAILGVAISSLIGIVCLLRCWFSVGRLGRIRRQSPALPHDANRILYINANLWFGVRAGGSVGHIAGVVNAFADSGFHVDLVSANAQVMLRDSVRQSLLQAPKTFGFPYELNYFRCNYRALRQLKRFAASRRYRFVYQRMSVINYVGVALSRLLHVPFVLEYNGSEIWVAKNWGRPLHFSRLGLAIENICLSHAYRVVVVSRVLADELVERGIERDRIVWYPNCVDPKHYSPEVVRPEAAAELRKRHGISADAVLIAFVGTFGVWHGAPVLAAAIKQLVDRDSRWLEENSVRFAMIGDGLKMKDVCELIGGAAYSPWVVFVGLVPQPDTVQYLAVADILVSPHIRNGDGSRFFGSPTKLFEYMAMAKAIIASDLDQIGEVLSSGIRVWDREMQELTSTTGATAVLARPGNIDDLVAGMKLLVERRGLRTQVGLNARAELLRRYTWRHHVAHILAALGEGSTEEADDAAVA